MDLKEWVRREDREERKKNLRVLIACLSAAVLLGLVDGVVRGPRQGFVTFMFTVILIAAYVAVMMLVGYHRDY